MRMCMRIYIHVCIYVCTHSKALVDVHVVGTVYTYYTMVDVWQGLLATGDTETQVKCSGSLECLSANMWLKV